MELPRRTQGGDAVLRLADDVESLRLEQGPGARTEPGVIVDDENGGGDRTMLSHAAESAIRLATP